MTNQVTTAISKPEIPQGLQVDMSVLSEQAMTVTITNKAELDNAGELFNLYHRLIKEIKTYFAPLKENTHKAWKSICDAEKKELEKLEPVKEHLSAAITAFQREEQKRREEEERKRSQEARKQLETTIIEAAVEAEQQGFAEEARELLNTPLPPVQPVEVEKLKVKGVASVKRYTFRITNLKALVDAVAGGKVPILAVQANTVFIGQQVRSLRLLLDYPGVEVVETETAQATRQ